MVITKSKKSSPMREIKIEKLVMNICVGRQTDRVTYAGKVLEELTTQKPVFSKARLTIRSFGIRRNQKISTHVTVRGPNADKILRTALKVKDFSLSKKCFNNTGNFGFGIIEHMDLGIPFHPKFGKFGMDITVVLQRPGKRVSKRKRCKSRVGKPQRITPDDAMGWLNKNYSVTFT